MPLNPLAPVVDYQSMLNRIFWFTTVCALGCVYLLRLHVPAVEVWLGRIDFAVATGGGGNLPTRAGYLLPALAVGIASRIYRLHARLSDWLGLRECFDVDVIIAEFADELDIDMKAVVPEQWRKSRHAVMRKAFYPYVSGAKPEIDSQLVQQALDAWSWFWIGLEATTIVTVTGFTLVACEEGAVGLQTLAGALAFAVLGLPSLRNQCKRYAIAQVRAILADATRAAVAREAIAAVASPTLPLRIAG
jgi:hypothetical protein